MGELKVLVLGDGLLGKEFVKITGCSFLSRKATGFDINDLSSIPSDYNVIINCIANTNTYSENREDHWDVNYVFVSNLINYCNLNNIKLVHISTDYIYSGSKVNASELDVPVHCNNWYGYTKLLSDGLVQLQSNNYLLCRCTHKSNPFPYESAWVDQIGNFDYVDVIATLIIKMVNNNLSGIYNVGTDAKTMYELASQTRSVGKTYAPELAPKNTTMDISKLKKSINIPFFSIAIPAYGYNGNGASFLENNFTKLKSQTFTDFEVVVSDHSEDDTIFDLCKSWSDRLRITYIRNDKGRGIISPNLNTSMANCSGEWIKILFQDDFLFDDNSLLKTFNFIKNKGDIQWLASRFIHSDDGHTYHRELKPIWDNNIWCGNNSIGCPSVICVKNKNVLFFDDELNWLMDCEYYQRMFRVYGEPSILDEITVVNRSNADRLTNTIPQEVKSQELQKLSLIYG